jgi:hypothetical protein
MILKVMEKKPVQNCCCELDEIKISHNKEIVPCFMFWCLTAMIDNDTMDLQNCINVEKDVPGPFGKAYPTSHDANQAMNIKAEVSGAEEEEEPVPITFAEIKTTCGELNISVCPLLGRYHKCVEMPTVFLMCISLSVHLKQLHSVD